MATKATDGDVGTLPAATLDTLQIVTTGPLPEAPVSLTVKLIYRGYDTMVTIRDHTGKGAFTKLTGALDWIEANGGGPTVQRPAQSAPPAATNAGPVGLATGVMSGAGEGGGVIPAAWYVVAPEPGGKERVSFWNVSRDYAEISMVKPVGGSAPLFVNVGPTEFGEHRIPVNVHFTWGKDRGKGDGSRYRDVVRIERAA